MDNFENRTGDTETDHTQGITNDEFSSFHNNPRVVQLLNLQFSGQITEEEKLELCRMREDAMLQTIQEDPELYKQREDAMLRDIK